MHRHFRGDADKREPRDALGRPRRGLQRDERAHAVADEACALRAGRRSSAPASNPRARRCRRAPALPSRRGPADRRRAHRGRAPETRGSGSPRRCDPCRRRAGRWRAAVRRSGRRRRRSPEPAFRPTISRMSAPLRGAERLFEIGDDVLRPFEPHRQPHHVLADPGLGELLGAHLAMRGAGGMDDQRLGVADIGEMARKPQRLDEARPRRPSALDAEGDDRAGAARQQPLRQLVVGMARRARDD